jgi:arabinose-5-phosphate isomerase
MTRPGAGVYTDGDLRRTLDKGIDVHKTPIGEVMTRTFKHAAPGMLAVEALKLMEDHKISALPVMDNANAAGGRAEHARPAESGRS